jgi:hypothetical protein
VYLQLGVALQLLGLAPLLCPGDLLKLTRYRV